MIPFPSGTIVIDQVDGNDNFTRQALRDITETFATVEEVVFPTKPV